MASNKFFGRVLSTLTLVAYSTTAFLAPASQAAGFYRPQMQVVAGLYTKASDQAAHKQDLSVFTKAFGAEVLNQKDAAFISKSLSVAEMPEITVDKAAFVVTAKGSAPIRIQPVDLDKGIFKINGFEFTWNDKETFEQNANRIAPLANAKGFSLNINTLWDLVVPSSHAIDSQTVQTIAIAAAAVIGVALIGYFVYKAHKNSLKVDEVKARLDAGQDADKSVLDNDDNDDKKDDDRNHHHYR